MTMRLKIHYETVNMFDLRVAIDVGNAICDLKVVGSNHITRNIFTKTKFWQKNK